MNAEEHRKLEIKTGFKIVKKVKYLGVALTNENSKLYKIIMLKYGIR